MQSYICTYCGTGKTRIIRLCPHQKQAFFTRMARSGRAVILREVTT